MDKTFLFNTQLNIGSKGEELFLKYYKFRNAVKADGIKFDMFVDDGKTVELKTDTYTMENTTNFFMEQISNCRLATPGGPWRALEDKVDFFVYFFIHDKTFFWFDPKTLVPFLNTQVMSLRHKIIKNKTWETLGYAVPRELCEDYCVKVDKF